MSRLGSSYPGGPRREDDDGSSRPSRLRSAEDLEERGRRRYLRARSRRRRRAGILVVVVVGTMAGGIGYALGRQEMDPTRERASATPTAEEAMKRQLNRVMLELWQMEEVEARRR